MAFNPFNVFRRYQKTLFAVLTIFVMVMFVFSFGQGDFFQWLPKWLGSKKGQGDVVAVVNGSKLYESEISQREGARELASQFMARSSEAAANKMAEYIDKTSSTVSRDHRAFFQNLVKDRQTNYINMKFLEMGLPFEQVSRFSLQMIDKQIGEILSAQPPVKEDADLARVAQNMMSLDFRRMSVAQEGYFGHRAGGEASRKQTLEFDLWLRKAEKLGIRFTGTDARQMFAKEFYNQFEDGTTLAKIEKDYFIDKPNYSRDNVFNALADEYKVRAVQLAILGPGIFGQSGTAQAMTSPYEMYSLYRKDCVGATYAVAAVPTENFLDQVSGSPSEGELRTLFNKYRTVEFDPSKPTPGLKQPRMLKIGWLEIKGDEPVFQKLADDALKLGELQAKAAAFSGAMSPWNLLAAPTVANLSDATLAVAYGDYKDKFRLSIDTKWFPFNFDTAGALDTAVAKPSVAATAITALAGSSLTHSSLWSVPFAVADRITKEDRQQRARVLAMLLMPGAVTGGNAMGTALAAGLAMPNPLPLAAVRGELVQQVKNDKTREVAEKEISIFMDGAAKLGAKKDKSEVTTFIEKFAADHGLKSGGSIDFRDLYMLSRDTGLKPLVEKLERGHPSVALPMQFGQSLFMEMGPNRQIVPATSFYVPQPYPPTGGPLSLRENEPSYLAWRTAEVPAEAPKDFEQAKPKAEAAWRRLKARELARKTADQLQQQLNERLKSEKDNDKGLVIEQVFREIYGRYRERYSTDVAKFERANSDIITDVAPIVRNRMSFQPMNQNGGVGAFQLMPSRFLPNPSAAMRTALLDNKDSKPGTVLVLPDSATDIYYVAVLKERMPAGSNDFYHDVYNGVGELNKAVSNRVLQETRFQAIDQAVALLRAEFRVEQEQDKPGKSVAQGDE